MKPNPTISKKLRFIQILCIIGALAFGAVGVHHAASMISDAKEQDSASQYIQEEEIPAEDVTIGSSEETTIGSSDSSGKSTIGYSEDHTQAEAVPSSAETMTVDFDGLKQANAEDDIVGWIQIPNTHINYPVLQGEDNEYYLTHSYTGSPNQLGSIYMDFRVDMNNAPIYLMYGHHVSSGKMFSDLVKYKDKSFGEQNQIISFQDAAGKQTNWKVFAVCEADSTKEEDLQTYFATELPSQEEFEAYVNKIREKAVYTLNDEKEVNQMMVLSTCTEPSHSSTKRVIVCAAAE